MSICWTLSDPIHWEEILASYAAVRELVGQVEQSELQAMFALVGPASRGKLYSRLAMFDAGLLRYDAYQLNSTDGLYYAVLLEQQGDTKITNSADEATILAEWLRDVSATCQRSDGRECPLSWLPSTR